MKLEVLENAPLLLKKSKLKTRFQKKLEDFIGVSGVTIERNNPPKVVTIYSNTGISIFTYIIKRQPQALVSAKIPWSLKICLARLSDSDFLFSQNHTSYASEFHMFWYRLFKKSVRPLEAEEGACSFFVFSGAPVFAHQIC